MFSFLIVSYNQQFFILTYTKLMKIVDSRLSGSHVSELDVFFLNRVHSGARPLATPNILLIVYPFPWTPLMSYVYITPMNNCGPTSPKGSLTAAQLTSRAWHSWASCNNWTQSAQSLLEGLNPSGTDSLAEWRVWCPNYSATTWPTLNCVLTELS